MATSRTGRPHGLSCLSACLTPLSWATRSVAPVLSCRPTPLHATSGECMQGSGGCYRRCAEVPSLLAEGAGAGVSEIQAPISRACECRSILEMDTTYWDLYLRWDVYCPRLRQHWMMMMIQLFCRTWPRGSHHVLVLLISRFAGLIPKSSQRKTRVVCEATIDTPGFTPVASRPRTDGGWGKGLAPENESAAVVDALQRPLLRRRYGRKALGRMGHV